MFLYYLCHHLFVQMEAVGAITGVPAGRTSCNATDALSMSAAERVITLLKIYNKTANDVLLRAAVGNDTPKPTISPRKNHFYFFHSQS